MTFVAATRRRLSLATLDGRLAAEARAVNVQVLRG